MQRLRLLMAVAVTVGDLGGRSLAAAPAGEPVTFSGSIAGILHRHCAGCHHDGQPAPFNLVTYQDARKRAKQILAMVDRGLMPPWLAEPGHGEFSNERRLTAEERELLRRWVEHS